MVLRNKQKTRYDYKVHVCKWGDSLAVKLPTDVVDLLDLREGDDIEIIIQAKRESVANSAEKRAEAIEAIRRLARPFPLGFKFDREEANER